MASCIEKKEKLAKKILKDEDKILVHIVKKRLKTKKNAYVEISKW